MQYEAILSLGSNCVPAQQIERFFGRSTQSPFDFIVTPFDSLINVLDDDGKKFCQSISTDHRGGTAYCEDYGVFYHHEFNRNSRGNVIFTNESITNARSKLSHKYSKMIDIAKNHKTLFIRYVSGTDVFTDRLSQKNHLEPVDLDALLNAITKKIGHTNFHLALFKSIGNPYDLIPPEIAVGRDNVSIHYENYQGAGLPAENAAWDSFFIKMGFNQSDIPFGTGTPK